MFKQDLFNKIAALKEETRVALQTVFDELNHGQQKKLLKEDKIKELFDRFGVQYEG